MEEQKSMKTVNKFQCEINRCALLSEFTTEETHAYLKRVKLEGFSPGDEILTEGNNFHGLWILLSGTCEVMKQGCDADSRLATLEPGSIFGEMSFFHSVPHSASIRAVDHVETMRIMREEYDELRADCPSAAHKIAVNIISVLSDRLRKMDEWTCELVNRDSDGKRHKEWQEFRSKLYTGLFE